MQTDQCINCNNYRGQLTCLAFPDGIPEKIMTGEHDHNLHYPGDDASGVHVHFEALLIE